MKVRAWMSSIVIPARKAWRIDQTRSALGVASLARISSRVGCSGVPQVSFLSQPKPNRPTSRLRRAFWKLSRNVRPIAMTSPTDFICVVRIGSASGNFSNAQRGILVTT